MYITADQEQQQQEQEEGGMDGVVSEGRGPSSSKQQEEFYESESQRQLNRLLEAGRVGGGDRASFQLPLVEHAPGFEKYKGLAPGAAAHEAGYDAFMTGSCFAMLLRVKEAAVAAAAGSAAVGGTGAAGSATEAVAAGSAAGGTAGREASEAGIAAAAAVAAAVAAAGPAGLAAEAAAWGSMAVGGMNGSQAVIAAGGADVGMEAEAGPSSMQGAAAAAAGVVGDVLAPVREYRGRLNLGKSDLPYGGLEGVDPMPERAHVFHVGGLVGAWGPGLVVRILQGAGAEQVGWDGGGCIDEGCFS